MVATKFGYGAMERGPKRVCSLFAKCPILPAANKGSGAGRRLCVHDIVGAHSFAKTVGWLKEKARALDLTVLFVDHEAKPTQDNRNLDPRLKGSTITSMSLREY